MSNNQSNIVQLTHYHSSLDNDYITNLFKMEGITVNGITNVNKYIKSIVVNDQKHAQSALDKFMFHQHPSSHLEWILFLPNLSAFKHPNSYYIKNKPPSISCRTLFNTLSSHLKVLNIYPLDNISKVYILFDNKNNTINIEAELNKLDLVNFKIDKYDFKLIKYTCMDNIQLFNNNPNKIINIIGDFYFSGFDPKLTQEEINSYLNKYNINTIYNSTEPNKVPRYYVQFTSMDNLLESLGGIVNKTRDEIELLVKGNIPFHCYEYPNVYIYKCTLLSKLIYTKHVPLDWSSDQIKNLFLEFGTINNINQVSSSKYQTFCIEYESGLSSKKAYDSMKNYRKDGVSLKIEPYNTNNKDRRQNPQYMHYQHHIHQPPQVPQISQIPPPPQLPQQQQQMHQLPMYNAPYMVPMTPQNQLKSILYQALFKYLPQDSIHYIIDQLINQYGPQCYQLLSTGEIIQIAMNMRNNNRRN